MSLNYLAHRRANLKLSSRRCVIIPDHIPYERNQSAALSAASLVGFRDDECRIRTKNAPANFATLKHDSSNLLRTSEGKQSLQFKRHLAAWDTDFLHSVIAR